MVRKIIDARERFGQAAMELFREQGYADVTVPQIAQAAGLTERTFYRYFLDKPEVLFWRAAELEEEICSFIRNAADTGNPLEVATHALENAGRFLDAYRDDSIARQTVIASHPNFQEREMLKLQSLASAIAHELREQGTAAAIARMAAETAVTIWRVAVDRWSTDEEARRFQHHVRNCLADLRTTVS